MTLSVLTERRVLSPYGMNGGESGKCGINLLCKSNGQIIYLGSKTAVNIETGDIFALKTPGGGGYGFPDENQEKHHKTDKITETKEFVERGSVFEYRQAQESV